MQPHAALRFQDGHTTADLFRSEHDALLHIATQTLRDVMDALRDAYSPGRGVPHPLDALNAYERGDYRAVADWHREYVAGSLEIDWLVQPAGFGVHAARPLAPAALRALRGQYGTHPESA